MKTAAVLPVLAGLVAANPLGPELEARQSCPGVFVFGARETTAPAGFGTAGGLVNMVTQAYSGSQSQAIQYPACGGQSQVSHNRCSLLLYFSRYALFPAFWLEEALELAPRTPKLGRNIADLGRCSAAASRTTTRRPRAPRPSSQPSTASTSAAPTPRSSSSATPRAARSWTTPSAVDPARP